MGSSRVAFEIEGSISFSFSFRLGPGSGEPRRRLVVQAAALTGFCLIFLRSSLRMAIARISQLLTGTGATLGSMRALRSLQRTVLAEPCSPEIVRSG